MTSGAGRFLILSIAPQYLEGLLQNSPTSFSIKAPLPRHPRWACTCVAARVCVCPLIGEAQLGLLFIPGPETQLALYSLSYQWLPCNERSQHNIARTSTSMTAQETQFSYDGTFSALAYILPTLYPFSRARSLSRPVAPAISWLVDIWKPQPAYSRNSQALRPSCFFRKFGGDLTLSRPRGRMILL